MNGRTILVKDVLGAVAVLGLAAIAIRLVFGLGASTALSDAVPWGLWKILNMVAGVALATGGFTLACTVHVLGLKKYRPILRPAILIAFLGYGSSCFALFLDIGLPHRIWHAIIYWNHHSFLFEVAWCVMLYFLVTIVEMAPVVLERSGFTRVVRWLHRGTLPVVIVGITLSTLHHSSLGSLFLITPTRLHEIWYTSWLPVLFFLSAVGGGMMSVVLVIQFYAWLKHREPRHELLRGIAVAATGALSLLFAVVLVDLTRRGAWDAVLSGTPESKLFAAEILLAIVVPCVLVAIPATRRSTPGLTTAAACAVVGLVLNRLDVGIFGYLRNSGVFYFPSLPEWALSLGILAAAALAFVWFSERFNIVEDALLPIPDAARPIVIENASMLPLWQILGRNRLRHVTLLPVIFLPLGALLFWTDAVRGYPLNNTPVVPPKALDETRAVLCIDGDMNGDYVIFRHARHQKDLGGSESCRYCHHLSLPGDQQTPCHRCHTDMYRDRSIFDHDFHVFRVGYRLANGLPTDLSKQSASEPVVPARLSESTMVRFAPNSTRLANQSCRECHTGSGPMTGQTARACTGCHGRDMGLIREDSSDLDQWAPGYVTAFHTRCIECHKKEGAARGRPELGECRNCHRDEGQRLPEHSKEVANLTDGNSGNVYSRRLGRENEDLLMMERETPDPRG